MVRFMVSFLSDLSLSVLTFSVLDLFIPLLFQHAYSVD